MDKMKPAKTKEGGTDAARAGEDSRQKTPKTPVPPLFRRMDWLAFAITALFVFSTYFYTMAPDVTLQDSGELAVGSFYAGVPHPPGYPLWTIYTWLFTVLLPFSNVAWRVAMANTVSATLSCAILALMVSRFCSMLIEGIDDLKEIDKRVENAICVVSGFVTGCLLAFNGYFWSQAVIVEVYCFGVFSLMGVLCCMMRWLYAPHQMRYAYFGALLFGISITNHQTILVAAMGLEVAILAVNRRLGRDLFLFNGVIYLAGLVAKSRGYVGAFDNNVPLFTIYNVIGIGSIYTGFWYSLKSDWFEKGKLVLFHGAGNILLFVVWISKGATGSFAESYTLLLIVFNGVGIVLLFFYNWLNGKTERVFTEWRPVAILAAAWTLGASFYLYMPLSSMTNPPMNWGYARTKEGFFHALSRGQYEKTNPTNSAGRLISQVMLYWEDASEEFSPVYLLLGIVPFIVFNRMKDRERSWIIGISAIFLCLALLLLILMNPSTDRATRDLIKVFFTSSYVMLALFIGYGLALSASYLAVRYKEYRQVAIYCGLVFIAMAVFALFRTFEEFDFPMRRFVAVFGVALAAAVVAVLWVCKNKAPMVPLLGLFMLMPVYPICSHWPDNEQRGHLFGFWFGHDMFTPPQFNKPEQIYPKMAKDAVLFGGTDPGRFCPTYMIFCESFIPPSCRRDPDFDRRDVYLITQNALADGTYLNYIRAHYNRSTQIDPPFFQDMLRSQAEIESNLYTNALARAVAPLDRFFTGLGAKIEARRRKEGVYPPKEIQTPTPEESKRCFEDYISDAQRRLSVGQLEPGEDVRIIDGRVQVSGQVSVMQINGLLTKVIFDRNPDHEFYVEESFPLKWMYPHLTPFGIIMKINRQPIKEMTEDIVRRDHEFWSLYSERLCGNWITYDTTVKEICDFAERIYLRGNLKGYKGDRKFLRDNDAQKAFSKLRSAIGGLYAWRINACKPASAEYQRMIKEAEFSFKQSFAFCPYSPEAVFRYSNLLAGMGRFEDAIRLAATCQKFDPENRGIEDLLKQLNLMKQGQFSVGHSQGQTQVAQLEQAYTSNPADAKAAMSLASAYYQMQQSGRADEIVDKVISQLEPMVKSNAADAPNAFLLFNAYVQRQKVEEATAVMSRLVGSLEAMRKANPSNLVAGMHLAQAYLQVQKNVEATLLIDSLVAAPYVDVNTLLFAAQVWMQYDQMPKLEIVLSTLVRLMPANPEAWYDLTAVRVKQGKTAEALQSFRECVKLSNDRLAKQPGSRDLVTSARADAQFQALQSNAEFKKLTTK